MATTLNLGKVMVTPGGEHDTSTAYERLTLVTSGGSSYISKKDVPAGVALTDTTYWQLHGAKGADGTNGTNGVDGEDAYQPFKGWFDSSSALSSAYPSPQVGDFAYVKGATSTDPVAIYACSTAGTWADSGNTFNPANNQEFASGEALNTVHIVDGLESLSATDVLSAKQGKVLDQKVADLGLEIGEMEERIGTLALGKFYGYRKNAAALPALGDEDGYAYVGTASPYSVYNATSSDGFLTWKDSGATFSNLAVADEEDIGYNGDGKLQLANRVAATNQKGYKILRKGVSLATQVTDANTIYEVRYDHELDAALTLPAGCVLSFNGGTIRNGTIVGNATRLEHARLQNVVLKGTFVGDFDDKEVELSTTLAEHPLAELFGCGFEKVTLGRNYSIPTLPNIAVPNGTREIVINGTISRSGASTKDTTYLFDLYEVDNCHIHGTGRIVGSKNYEGTNTGEWQHAFNLRHCSGVTIEGLAISGFNGDGIAVADYMSSSIDPLDWAKCSTNIRLENLSISDVGRNGISVIHADNVRIANCRFKDITNAPGAAIDLEPNVGRKTIDGEYVYPKKYVQNIVIDNIDVEHCKIAVCTYASYSGYVNNIDVQNVTARDMAGVVVSLYMCRNLHVRNAYVKGGETAVGSVFGGSAFHSVSFEGVYCDAPNASAVFVLCGNSKGANGIGVNISNSYFTGCNQFIQFASSRHAPASTDVVVTNCVVRTTGKVIDQYADNAASAPNRLSVRNCRFLNDGETQNVAMRYYAADGVDVKGCTFEGYNVAAACYGTKNFTFSGNRVIRSVGSGVMFTCNSTCDNFILEGNTFEPSEAVNYMVDMGGIKCQLLDNVGEYLLNFYRNQSNYANIPNYVSSHNKSGSTSRRPTATREGVLTYCNTSVNRMQMSVGGKWYNADGTPADINIIYI